MEKAFNVLLAFTIVAVAIGVTLASTHTDACAAKGGMLVREVGAKVYVCVRRDAVIP